MEVSIYSITSGVFFVLGIGIIQRHVKSGGPNVRSIFMDGIIEVVPGRKEAGMVWTLCVGEHNTLLVLCPAHALPMHLTINVLSSQWVNPLGQSKFAETP